MFYTPLRVDNFRAIHDLEQQLTIIGHTLDVLDGKPTTPLEASPVLQQLPYALTIDDVKKLTTSLLPQMQEERARRAVVENRLSFSKLQMGFIERNLLALTLTVRDHLTPIQNEILDFYIRQRRLRFGMPRLGALLDIRNTQLHTLAILYAKRAVRAYRDADFETLTILQLDRLGIPHTEAMCHHARYVKNKLLQEMVEFCCKHELPQWWR